MYNYLTLLFCVICVSGWYIVEYIFGMYFE